MARNRNLRSEYELDGTHETGIFPKGQDALDPGEKMRLMYLTGTTDPEAPIDRAIFHGTQSAEDREELFRPQMPEEADPEGEVPLP